MDVRRQRAIALIGSEDDWPLWPVLPMKRPKEDGGMPDTAVMYTGEHNTLYLDVNVFALAVGDLPNSRKQTFDSLDALLDAGWVVD